MTQMNARILSGRTADVFEKLDILEEVPNTPGL